MTPSTLPPALTAPTLATATLPLPTALAIATALALATTFAQAQAPSQATIQAPSPSVTLYGVLDLAVYQRQLAGQARDRQVISGGMTTSYWGLRGSEDLGGGLRTLFDLSGFLRADTGEAGRSAADPYWGRFAWVGLQAPWGTLRLGRQSTAAFINTIRFNPFGDSASFSPTFLHAYLASATQPMMTGSGASDSAWSNSVGYHSPNLSGLTVSVQLAPSEGGPAGRRAALGATYVAGPWAAGLSAEKLDHMALNFSKPPAALPIAARQSLNVGSSCDFGAVVLYGQFVRTRLDDAGARITLQTTQLGAAVPVGDGRVLASWARTTKDQTAQSGSTRNTLALGYDHALSKRSDLYAVLLADRLNNAVDDRSSGTGLALGMRHRF